MMYDTKNLILFLVPPRIIVNNTYHFIYPHQEVVDGLNNMCKKELQIDIEILNI